MWKDLIKIVHNEKDANEYIMLHQKEHEKELKYIWQTRPGDKDFIVIYTESEKIEKFTKLKNKLK